jgi:hypothetical protein
MFRPAGMLTAPVAPPATAYPAGQPWFLRRRLSWVVTSPCPGYACRPNRAMDGRGLSPHQMRSLVGCSPNAGRQPPLEADARHERTLYAVACTPSLGGAWVQDAVPPSVPLLRYGLPAAGKIGRHVDPNPLRGRQGTNLREIFHLKLRALLWGQF